MLRGSDLSAPVMPALLPLSQVLGSEGVSELRSSASALGHVLDESASLLTMFWRAALPSSHSPVLPGKAVRDQHPFWFCPQLPRCVPSPADPEDQEPRGESDRQDLGETSVCGSCCRRHSDHFSSRPTPRIEIKGERKDAEKGETGEAW